MNGSRILTLGSAYMDVHIPGFPFDEHGLLPETETIGGDYGMTPGGSAVNFARVCTQLGLSATFVGKTGNDVFGQLLAQKLREEGVAPELIADASVSTNIGVNAINENGHTIMLVAGTANRALHADEVVGKVLSLLESVDYLYLGGCFKLKKLMPAFEQLAERAEQKNVKIVVDHGRVPKNATAEDKANVRSLVARADYYFPSQGEFMELWHASDVEAGLRRFTAKAGGTIAVKCASDGAYSVLNGDIVHVPAFHVTPHNTAGAGDTFNAGFIAARHEGFALRKSLEFACAVAALKISRDTLPSRADVDAFLAQRPDVFTPAS
ncbi:MAG TPA: carbohydrate kinase family protein [Candidatus Saccharimonadales bacterium]|nr:carbohydrate kinase family protein [Candidatus Saccharimonadales bacterium]